MTQKQKEPTFQQITFKLKTEHAERIWKMVRKEMVRLGYKVRDVAFRPR